MDVLYIVQLTCRYFLCSTFCLPTFFYKDPALHYTRTELKTRDFLGVLLLSTHSVHTAPTTCRKIHRQNRDTVIFIDSTRDLQKSPELETKILDLWSVCCLVWIRHKTIQFTSMIIRVMGRKPNCLNCLNPEGTLIFFVFVLCWLWCFDKLDMFRSYCRLFF